MISTSSNGKKETPSLFKRKQPKESEENQVTPDKRESAFDQDSVTKFWKEFGKERISKGAGDAEKLVLSRTLRKSGDSDLEIELGSRLEMSILEKFEPEFVQYFRDKLQNDLVMLKKAVQVHEETQKLYTSQDKFEFMVKENPSLKALKDKLGLDFEY